MKTNNEKILAKIKKCLALSESPEPAEAAAALRQAQKMMVAHNISQTDINLSDIGEVSIKSSASVSKVKPWELALFRLVSDSFGCQIMWRKSSSHAVDNRGSYTLIGPKTQVELANYVAIVMQRKLYKARQAYIDTLPKYSMPRARKTVEANGFCHGWVSSIQKTIANFINPKETTELISSYISGRTSGRVEVRQGRLGGAGLEAGVIAGAKESLSRPMGADTNLRIN